MLVAGVTFVLSYSVTMIANWMVLVYSMKGNYIGLLHEEAEQKTASLGPLAATGTTTTSASPATTAASFTS